ncbi:MAG: hypothetical protein HLX50_02820 [Alteromonadaceae bacterium]|nr:hypothetical protein [Alteromonadaceae bacterium]
MKNNSEESNCHSQQLDEALRRARTLRPPVAVPPAPVNVGIVQRMNRAQHNLLAMWREKDYSIYSSKLHLVNQDYVICNSPDTVRRVFLEQHDNYDPSSVKVVGT